MFAVIFKAKEKLFDNAYQSLAGRLRELAIAQYGCRDFISVNQNGQEIAISYWNTLEDIKRWKSDPLHLIAQQKGRTLWYQNYQIEVVEILRQYQFKSDDQLE